MDPHVWLSAFTIRGKILQRSLFLKRHSWDEVIEDSYLKDCRKWETELKYLETVAVPRCFRHRDGNPVGVELYLFSDSTQQDKRTNAYLWY